ncbi:fimbrial protein [Yersinia enterocolitica]|uniref:fimbrial protein n=1 Tax=Yersinia enterocolitica TaxID=630 RepID=UPI000AC429E7|nr:fimbrial protein [Yersinia enterocolitica]
MTNKLTLAALLVTPILFSGTLFAAGEGASAGDMTFKGTLIEPPVCTPDGKTIEVDFGEHVMTSRVEDGLYTQPLKHGLDCKGSVISDLKLKIVGTAASFDPNSLQTTADGLAIEVSADSKKLAINEWLNFDKAKAPEMQVVLVKGKDAELKGGKFTATATMMVDYQ